MGLAPDSDWKNRLRRVIFYIFGDAGLFIVFGIIVAYHAGLMMRVRLFPFMDLPSHLAMATVLRYYHDPATSFAQTFVLDLFLKANIFHLFFCALPVFPTVEFANHIFYALYVILLPLSALLVIRQAGGNRWHALLAVLLLYNYNTVWGFTGFTFAIPLVLFTLILIHRYAYEGSSRAGVMVALALAGLFFVHLLAALFGIMVHLAACVANPHEFRRRFFTRVAVLAPVMLILALWIFDGQAGSSGTGPYLARYYRDEFWSTFKYREILFFNDFSMILAGPAGRNLGRTISFLLLACLALPLLRGRRALRADLAGRRLYPLLAFTACALACYTFLPPNVPINPVLHQRFSCYFFLGVVMLGGALAPAATGLNRARAIVIAVIIYSVLWTGFFREFDRVNQGFNPGMMPEKGMLATATRDRYRDLPVYGAFSNYYIIWCRRVGVTSIQLFSKLIMAQRPGTPRLLGPAWLYKEDAVYNPRVNYPPVDHLLIRGALTPADLPSKPPATLLRRDGEWTLYRIARLGPEPASSTAK